MDEIDEDFAEEGLEGQGMNNAKVIQELADKLNALSIEHSACKVEPNKVNPYEDSAERIKQFRKRSSSGRIEESWKIEEEEVSPSPMFTGRNITNHLKRLNLFVKNLC